MAALQKIRVGWTSSVTSKEIGFQFTAVSVNLFTRALKYFGTCPSILWDFCEES